MGQKPLILLYFPDYLVEIRVNLLRAVENLVFPESFLVRLVPADFPIAIEDIVAPEFQELVHACGKLLHVKSNLPLYQASM